MKKTILILILLSSSLFCYSQNFSICKEALRQDVTSLDMDINTSLHYLNIMDRAMYKQSQEAGGLDATIPIKGVPIQVGFDYDDFEEWRSRYFEKTEFKYDKDESYRYIRTFTSEKGYNSFDNCINRISEIPGLYIEVVENDPEIVQIEIYYQPGTTTTGGDLKSIKISSSNLVNGRIDDAPSGKIFSNWWFWRTEIAPNQKITKTIKREKNKYIYGELNAGGYTARFKADAFKKVITPPCAQEIILIDACKFVAKESVNITSHIDDVYKGHNPHGYGFCVITNNNNVEKQNKATYYFDVECSGKFKIEIRHAALGSRPVELILNNKTITSNACSETTGGWNEPNLKWHLTSNVNLSSGTNKLVLFRTSVFPSIREIRISPVN